MDFETVKSIGTEVGIGVTAITAIVYLVITLRKSHEREVKEMRQERKETQQAFMSFVETNNHQRTDIIHESTKALVEAKNAIATHSGVLNGVVQVLHDIREDAKSNRK